jgi:hypothetical protein
MNNYKSRSNWPVRNLSRCGDNWDTEDAEIGFPLAGDAS